MYLDPTQHAELERDERWLASLMTPRPADETVCRVRGAFRVALDEQWLASAVTPAPEPNVLVRVKSAVRRKLSGGSRGVRYRVFGALSAAASVLLSVGVVRFAASGMGSSSEVSAVTENFAAAWDAISESADLSSLTADMVWIDAEINAWAEGVDNRRDELELESLQDQIDTLLTMPDYFDGEAS